MPSADQQDGHSAQHDFLDKHEQTLQDKTNRLHEEPIFNGWTPRLGIKGTTGTATVPPGAFPTNFEQSTSTNNLKKKWMNRLEALYRRNTWRHALTLAWRKVDIHGDKICNRDQIIKLLTTTAALYPQDAMRVYETWDPDMIGTVALATVLADLDSLDPTYEGSLVNPPPSKEDLPPAVKSKSNMPSQPGGIFGGGAWEEEADQMKLSTSKFVPAHASQSLAEQRQESFGAKGGNCSNISSIAGGIFGPADEMLPPPRAKKTSNTSSVPGGIFAVDNSPPPPARVKKTSNTSSVPGGIFAPDPPIRMRDVDYE